MMITTAATEIVRNSGQPRTGCLADLPTGAVGACQRTSQDRGLAADDTGCDVLGCGPSPLIKPGGHVFLLDLAE
jgi:hypothetical protein